MFDLINGLFYTGDFMPHGHCYLWEPGLVRLHLLSDLSIGAAYVAISLTLVWLVRQSRREIPFHWMFLAFGLFIVSCGCTHLMEVWTLWTPVYWMSGAVKLLTAVASVATAVCLPPLVPKTRQLVLDAEISERRRRELESANQELAELYRQLEQRSQEKTYQLAAIVESSDDAIIGWSLEGVIQTWNGGAARIYGYTAEEAIGKPASMLLPYDRAAEQSRILEQLRRGERVEHLDTLHLRKGGGPIHVSVTVSPVRNAEGQLVGASHIARDITERKMFQEKLQQTQKLESLGVLAGGVAHDFNNLLTGILGNASLALDSLSYSNPNRSLLEEVVQASQRAADLTRQLLAYAGKGRFVTRLIDLSDLVREISSLVQTSIPKDVQVRLQLAPDLPALEGDPGQLQQVIMNLVINGAEAIGESKAGTVLVTTAVQQVDEEYIAANLSDTEFAPGTYIVLEVHDNGSGMDEATKSRIFDPFFTTKFTGRGLGLSAVLGIVRGHKGALRVYSTPGQGSTFKVLLPSAAGAVEPAVAASAVDLRGSGTVLVVDDEPIIRKTARNALERFGYTVIEAENGEQAITIFRGTVGRIALILLDLTMPVMGGEECLRRMRQIDPAVKVLLSSGFNEVEAVRRFTGKGLAGFIQKPYTALQLAQRVKRALTESHQ